ncbi:MAG: hypothetical protein ABI361_00975 [Nitrososphaera sp.]
MTRQKCKCPDWVLPKVEDFLLLGIVATLAGSAIYDLFVRKLLPLQTT